MKKLYEYVDAQHRVNETLTLRECGHGVYFGVDIVRALPHGDFYGERLSVIVPNEAVDDLISALLDRQKGLKI